ncbi:MAG: reverse transcriptase/maturase family protein [Candidatus Uhrbacteria bacterium]|nr:reverse transcriptase/maturase family protein [Candidatus Uhrbacteria bacterium]
MFNKITSLENLFLAWEKFKKGKIEKRDVCEFAMRVEDNIFALHDELVGDKYRHSSYENFFVHDPKRRHISKASVKDRVVHQAVAQVIEPIFERLFIFDSYSSRVGKGTHMAVKRLQKFLRKASKNGHVQVYALKCDVKKFFDSIRHDVILRLIGNVVRDEQSMSLIRKIVASYAIDDENLRGLPLGNVTSQLFANVYLDSLDHFVKEHLRMRWYLRFCDDFLIIHSDRALLEVVLPRIEEFLSRERTLALHPDKVTIRKFSQGIDFVGQVLRPRTHTLRIKTKRRIVRRARFQIQEYKNGRICDEEFRQSLQSYFGILAQGDNHTTLKALKEDANRIFSNTVC